MCILLTLVWSEVWSISDSCFWQCSQKGYLSPKQPSVYGKEMFPSVPAAGFQQHGSVRVCWRPCLVLPQALLSWLHAGKEVQAGNKAARSAKSCLAPAPVGPALCWVELVLRSERCSAATSLQWWCSACPLPPFLLFLFLQQLLLQILASKAQIRPEASNSKSIGGMGQWKVRAQGLPALACLLCWGWEQAWWSA